MTPPPADPSTPDPDPTPGAAPSTASAAGGPDVEAERRRSRRSVSFILAVVAAAVAVMAGLAVWVLAVPYDVQAPLAGVATDCSTAPAAHVDPAAIEAWEAACDDAEDAARSDRRDTAFVLGVGAFVVATAVSTWPSRRLTGERLGPLR